MREGGFDPDGKFYDVVIPNYLNPADYPFQPDGSQGDYYLYLGRLIKRKGIHIAVETCKRLGAKLKIAGQGCVKVEGNRIHCADGEVYEGDNLEYVGFATGEKRAQLYQQRDRHFCPHHVYRALRRGGDRDLRWRARRPSRPTSGRVPRDRGARQDRVSAATRWTSSCLRRATRRRLDRERHSSAGCGQLQPWIACGGATKSISRCLSDLWGEGWYARARANAA